MESVSCVYLYMYSFMCRKIWRYKMFS